MFLVKWPSKLSFLKNFSNSAEAFKDRFSWISHYKNTLVFHVDSKLKLQNYECDFITQIKFLCTQQGHLHDQSVAPKVDIFQQHREKKVIGGGLNMESMGLENEDFLININANAYILENSSYTFSSYNASILIFQKRMKKYNEFQQKMYTLNSENVAQNLSDLRDIFFSRHFCFNKHEIFSTQSTYT